MAKETFTVDSSHQLRRKDRAITEPGAIRGIMDAADACRIGFSVQNRPYIVTLNFGYVWDADRPTLFFHCAREGRKLEAMKANPEVCFELDTEHELITAGDPCGWGMRYASVVGYGRLAEVLDEGEQIEALGSIMRHHGWDGRGGFSPSVLVTTTVLKLVVSELSAKRKA